MSVKKLPSAVLIPLLISGCGIALAAFSVLIYHFLIVRFCLRRYQERRSAEAVSFAFDVSGDEKTGLDKKLLHMIPIVGFTGGAGAGDGECAICLGELEEGSPARLLPNCRHAFHVECVDEWLAARVTCPNCRAQVFPFTAPEFVVELDGDEDGNGAPDSRAVAREVRRALSMNNNQSRANSNVADNNSDNGDNASSSSSDSYISAQSSSPTGPVHTPGYFSKIDIRAAVESHRDRRSSRFFRSLSQLRLSIGNNNNNNNAEPEDSDRGGDGDSSPC